MIDDGKYDPVDKKIENHERALNDFIYWERELRTPKPNTSAYDAHTAFQAARRRFWRLVECVGNTYYPGGF